MVYIYPPKVTLDVYVEIQEINFSSIITVMIVNPSNRRKLVVKLKAEVQRLVIYEPDGL